MYNNAKTVMIHEVTEDVLSKDLSEFDVISFDDGLYSQYLNLKHYLALPQPKYFFISTDIVYSGDTQNKEVIECAKAHQKAFNGNFENYMTWEQIIDIYNTPNCFIGGHSHTHNIFKTLKENIADTNTMMDVFRAHNVNIDSYCYPYNNEYSMRELSLAPYRIKKKFGRNRMPVEEIKDLK